MISMTSYLYDLLSPIAAQFYNGHSIERHAPYHANHARVDVPNCTLQLHAALQRNVNKWRVLLLVHSGHNGMACYLCPGLRYRARAAELRTPARSDGSLCYSRGCYSGCGNKPTQLYGTRLYSRFRPSTRVMATEP